MQIELVETEKEEKRKPEQECRTFLCTLCYEQNSDSHIWKRGKAPKLID